MRSLRGLPRGVLLAVVVAFAALSWQLLGLLDAHVWIRAAVAVMAFVVAGAVEVDKELLRRREAREVNESEQKEREEAEFRWLHDVRDSLRCWPLPTVDDVDPYALGVTRSRLADRYTSSGEGVAEYIGRDVDRRCAERLRGSGLLLLVGVPASGVTRSAFECARGVRSGAVVLAPRSPDGLRVALNDLDVVSRLAAGTQVLVWLDRIDMFSESGLTAAMLELLREQTVGLRVVATIASTRYEMWVTGHSELAELFGEPVTLGRALSASERHRAENRYPSVDFGEGIAGAFTAVTALLRRSRAGHSGCPFEPAGGDCGLSRAMIALAADWRATGTTRPLSVHTLLQLVTQPLGSNRSVDPAHAAEALQWGLEPLVEGPSLLCQVADSDGGQYVAMNEQLAEVLMVNSEGPSYEAWCGAIADAESRRDSEAVGQIGFRAHMTGCNVIAGYAWAAITDLDEPAAEWLSKAAAYSFTHRDPAGELQPHYRLLDLIEATSGPDSPRVAMTLDQLGNAWRKCGQAATARDLHERALRIAETTYGPRHVNVAVTLERLGNAWFDLGRPDISRDMHERALQIKEHFYGVDHVEIATNLGELGGAWTFLGEPDKARIFYERVLVIQEREYGPDHPDVAITLDNLGIAWRKLAQPDTARSMLERALQIQERAFGDDDREVGATVANLGGAWFDLGQVAIAREMLERALRIAVREYGHDHAKVAGLLANIASTWNTSGDPGAALGMYERALRIQEREYGSTHPVVGATIANLGSTLFQLGRHSNACEKFERALQIQEGAYGPDHPELATILFNLGTARGALGQLAAARDILQRALQILAIHFPDGHPVGKAIAENLRIIAPDLIVYDNGRIYSQTDTTI
ncbi:tetratricopeptide repeat protein [Antrihabitans stalactiti]|uniref:tetratricopeptide repeat protein n=1 Tax=Antrihabitans stalactiti TaxID=2584121 RepID=UPI00146CF99E